MPKFKTQYNTDEFPSKKEKNRLPSMTVADQSMSMREIMQRYARGLPIEGQKVPFYDEDDDMPDLTNLDLAEKEALIRDAKYELEEIEARKKERSDEDARLKKEREKAFKKEAADKADEKTDTDKVDENTNVS